MLMFTGCSSLRLLDISNFNTSKVEDMHYMFRGCSSLTSLNIINFDTSKVKTMYRMFSDCSSLTSLNISNFDTSQVANMAELFRGCSSLRELDISNFNTSLINSISCFCCFCSSLRSLDISNFDTSQVEDMQAVFYDCQSLTSLNLSNFKTSKVTVMGYMFYNCQSLTSLDLSYFDTTLVTDMEELFAGCKNLEYINLKNLKENNSLNYVDIFSEVPDNIVVCINEDSSKILDELKNKKSCYNIECSKDWKSKQKKLINGNNICINNCSDDEVYKYEYNGLCYENCSKGFLSNSEICKCELDKCLICSPLALKNNLCTKCNINYYPKEKDDSNIGEYINCYKELNGYYLDLNNSIFKKCFDTCETCEIKGDKVNHNCLKCKSNYNFEISNNNNYLNCYENCSYYYYFDVNNIFHCTVNYSCPDGYNKLIPDKMKCIDNCSSDDIYKYEYENICYKEYQFQETEFNEDISTENYDLNDNNTFMNSEFIISTNIIIENKNDNKTEKENLIELICKKDKYINNNNILYNYIINNDINNTLEELCEYINKVNETEKVKRNEEYIKYIDILLKILIIILYH